jgi:F0F1-type ATP synthase delta subunit
VLGGMSVQVGDEQINGTVAARLADVRRRLGAES